MNINRRAFLSVGAAAFALPAVAAISDATDRTSRRKRIDFKKSLEDNLIDEYLQPKKLTLDVGASKPFSALHFSDTHISMLDAAELLSWTARELSLYEARNNGVFGKGGFPFAMQSFAATVAYAKRRGIPMLNTGDFFDFRSEMNLEFVRRSFAGLDIFSCLGNHEGHGLHTPNLNPSNMKEDDALRRRFEEVIGNPLLLASRVINGVNFVAFDNTSLAKRRRKEQLAMMKAEFAKNLPTVLMCHMPPFTPELHEANCEMHRKWGFQPPKDKDLNSYYMMGEDFAKSKAPLAMRELMDFVKSQKNLKAFLCGHLHFEWQGTIGNGVPVCVIGRNFNGECYDISFT
jgi:hypothetical protein